MSTYNRAWLLGLPPRAEQARIVVKVHELMRLCDELEARGRLETQQHARLIATLFEALAASESSHALADNWPRVSSNFDLLLDRPEAVDALEQTILQLAVRGLLVPHDSEDGLASELVQRIRRQKNQMVSEGEIPRYKASRPIVDHEKLHSVPQAWEWVRLEEISITIVDCPHSTPKFTSAGKLCLDTNSFKAWELIPHKLRHVDDVTFLERNRR